MPARRERQVKETDMPFSDPEKRRRYQRDYQQRRRAGTSATPAQISLPTEFRLETARDALSLLAGQIEAVLADSALGAVERARCICQLIATALRAIQAGELEARLESVETALRSRRRAAQQKRRSAR